MSTKPSAGQLPTFDTALTNTTAITGGHQTSGFANNEIPTAAEINTLFAFLYLWCKYLSDGAFQGAVSFDTDITLAANINMILSGTGKYKRGVRTTKVSAAAGLLLGGATATGPTVSLQAVGRAVMYMIPSTDGERITSISVTSAPGTSGSQTLIVYVNDPVGGLIQVGSTVNSTGTALQTMTLGSLNLDIFATDKKSYCAIVQQATGTLGSAYEFEWTTTIP